jgi:ribosome-associated protein
MAWQVIDYFDVIVHVMRADVRERYDLESLWGDARRIGAKPKRRKPKKGKASPEKSR